MVSSCTVRADSIVLRHLSPTLEIMWFITIKYNHDQATFLTTKIYIDAFGIGGSNVAFKNPLPFGANNCCTITSPWTWEISPVQLIPMRKTLLDRGLNDDIIRMIMSFTYAKDLSDVPKEWVRIN